MTSQNGTSREAIDSWLVKWLAVELEMPAEDIDPKQSLLEYSMSSVTATTLVGDLEDWLGIELSPTLAWDYPTIEAMTEHLLAHVSAAPTPAAGGEAAASGGDAEMLKNLDALSEAEIDALLKRLDS